MNRLIRVSYRVQAHQRTVNARTFSSFKDKFPEIEKFSAEELWKEESEAPTQQPWENDNLMKRIGENQKEFNAKYNKGQLKEAKVLADEILKDSLTVFGNSHVIYASALNNLAVVEKQSGDYVTALTSYSDALQIYEKFYGKNHAHTVITLYNLAKTFKAYGEDLERSEDAGEAEIVSLYANCLELLAEVLKTQETNLGKHHEDVGSTKQLLGSVLDKIKRNNPDLNESVDKLNSTGAKNYIRSGAEIIENALGRKHMRTALAWNNYALFLKRQGDAEVSRQYYEKALDILESLKVSKSHPNVVLVKENLAELLYAMGETAAAAKLHGEIDADLEGN